MWNRIPKLIFVGCETGQYGDGCLPCQRCETCEINSGMCGKLVNEKEQSNKINSNGMVLLFNLEILNFYKYS